MWLSVSHCLKKCLKLECFRRVRLPIWPGLHFKIQIAKKPLGFSGSLATWAQVLVRMSTSSSEAEICSE